MIQHNCFNMYVVVLLSSSPAGIWQVMIQFRIPDIGRNRRISICIWQVEQYVLKR